MEREMTYLIWSNEHNAWWKAGSHGYSKGVKSAGHYTREQAIKICQAALPTAMHIGRISEVPVRLTDIKDVLKGPLVPECVL